MARKRTTKKPAPSRFHDSYESLKAKITENQARIKEVQGKAKDKMSENPMQTAAIAFGIGVVCGVGLKLLLETRRRD